MDIRFDPVKRQATLDERGLDFVDAAEVFAGPIFEFEDVRFAYSERRFSTIGLLGQRMVVVIWTEVQEGARPGRRIISMRKANEREQARFRSQLA